MRPVLVRVILALSVASLESGAGIIGQKASTRAISAVSNDATIRIMPMGDSITNGAGSTGNGGYRLDLYRQLDGAGVNFDFVGILSDGPDTLPDKNHQGYNGITIDGIRNSLSYWFSQNSPDIILLMVGTNDVLQLSDPANMPSRLSALIDDIYAFRPNATLIVGTPIRLIGNYAERNRWIRDYNRAIPGIVRKNAAQGRDAHFVDLYNSVDAAHLADDIHPNDSGYSRIAAVWHSKLRELLSNSRVVRQAPALQKRKHFE
jgi:lysophospholipase L1-like esterase